MRRNGSIPVNLGNLSQALGNIQGHLKFSWNFFFQNELGKILGFMKTVLGISEESWDFFA